MQINRLEVKNFKSLFNAKVSGFASVNFIHGYNNSGKSNFLKFLELLFMRKTIAIQETYLDENGTSRSRNKVVAITPFWNGYIYDLPFIFTRNKRKENIKFEVQLELNNNEYPHSQELINAGYLYSTRPSTPIKIKGEIKSISQGDSEMILNEVKIKNLTIFSRKSGTPRFFEEPAGSNLINNEGIFNNIMDVFNDSVMLIESERFFVKEPLLHESPELFSTMNFKNWLYGLNLDADKFDGYTSLIEFLNNFNVTSKVSTKLSDNLKNYPFKETSMNFSKFKGEIEVMLENEIGRFPLKNYGTGVQQLLFILTKVFTTSAKIILIEELELNLSPEYQELIINNLQNYLSTNKVTQVFFTSHSDYLYRNDFKTFEVTIDKDGKSEIKTSSYSNLKALRRNLLDYAETGKIKKSKK